MKIAAEHAEAVGQRSRVNVEEGLLFDGIALDASHVPPRHAEAAPFVEPNLAHPDCAFGQRAAVAARIAAQAAVIEHGAQLAVTSLGC
jgi:hypothetical protein